MCKLKNKTDKISSDNGTLAEINSDQAKKVEEERSQEKIEKSVDGSVLADLNNDAEQNDN